MDVDAFGKGKGKDDKKGKGTDVGSNFRRSRRSRSRSVRSAMRRFVGEESAGGCYVDKDDTDGKTEAEKRKERPRPLTPSRSPTRKGKGGKGKSPQVEAGYLELCNWETPATTQSGQKWVKLAVDTGAGATTWPDRISFGKSLGTNRGLEFRTATGEIIPSGEDHVVEGADEYGQVLRIKGVKAPVCKPLLSVGEVTDKGGAAVMFGNTGYLCSPGGRFAKKLERWFMQEAAQDDWHGLVELYKERNVYNLYMQDGGPADRRHDLCPQEMKDEPMAGEPRAGFYRQGRRNP